MFEAASRDFEWGWFDCGLWLADWYCYATQKPDPAKHLRGIYRNERSCAALFGTVPAARMVREIARLAELKRTNDPFFGDIGVIEIMQRPVYAATGIAIDGAPPKQIICGAIRARNSWTVLMPNGLQRIPEEDCRTVMAFSIEECNASSNFYSDCDRGSRNRKRLDIDHTGNSDSALHAIDSSVELKSAEAIRTETEYQAGDTASEALIRPR